MVRAVPVRCGAAGERVPAGVDDDLPGVAALAEEALCHTREPRALTVG